MKIGTPSPVVEPATASTADEPSVLSSWLAYRAMTASGLEKERKANLARFIALAILLGISFIGGFAVLMYVGSKYNLVDAALPVMLILWIGLAAIIQFGASLLTSRYGKRYREFVNDIHNVFSLTSDDRLPLDSNRFICWAEQTPMATVIREIDCILLNIAGELLYKVQTQQTPAEPRLDKIMVPYTEALVPFGREVTLDSWPEYYDRAKEVMEQITKK